MHRIGQTVVMGILNREGNDDVWLATVSVRTYNQAGDRFFDGIHFD